jgi:acetolactate synthase-1/2/3 large subunit
VRAEAPAPGQVHRAADVLREAKRPVVLAGHGAARADATAALIRFSEELGVPVANTFHGKGVMPDDHPNRIGTIGFMPTRRSSTSTGSRPRSTCTIPLTSESSAISVPR